MEDLSPRYMRSPAVVSREIEGETLAIPVCGGVGDLASIYGFNCTGTTIWAALHQPRSVDELVRMLEEEYELSGFDAKAEAVRFLGEICALGLAKTVAAAATEDGR